MGTETSLEILLSLIISDVSEHIICLVDNLAVQDDVESLRQRAVRGGGLVPHVVHQERPGQLLRPQQLACGEAVQQWNVKTSFVILTRCLQSFTKTLVCFNLE